MSLKARHSVHILNVHVSNHPWMLSSWDDLLIQDFVVSFFLELSVMMLERLYLDPVAKEVRPC